jgi:hypothetical protein
MLPTGRLFLALVCGCAALLARAASDVRFSATLSPDLRERTGISQLAPDSLAVIDGLVRQDEAASKFKNNDVDHTRFSERRTARERDLAGLNRLTPAQISLLDDLIGYRITGVPPASASSGTIVSTTGTAVKPNLAAQKLDIHGEIGFTYGWGKGGTFSGGDIILTYDDPAGRYGVLLGYSEYQGKGLSPCFYPGNSPYRALPFGH